MSSPDLGGDEVGLDGLVDLAGDGSFEDAHGVFVRLAESAEFLATVLCSGVVAESDQDLSLIHI